LSSSVRAMKLLLRVAPPDAGRPAPRARILPHRYCVVQ
jgi:hypothetical protein